MPSVSVPKFVKSGVEYVTSTKAYNYVSKQVGEGLKYTRTLTKDTVEFVRQHPKKTALAAGGGVALVLLGAVLNHTIEKKK